MQNKQNLDPVICGIDIGSWSVKIGCYDGSKFDILTNEANFRETPSLVAFTPAERMIGESANTKVLSKLKSAKNKLPKYDPITDASYRIGQECTHNLIVTKIFYSKL